MQCLGGNGYINGTFSSYVVQSYPLTSDISLFPPDFPMGRYLRDARLYAVGAGTQEIRRMLIGREFNEALLS